ncbi:MAG: hypothetical protein Q8O09_01545 [Bacillota bacterium]|nr:hypothetical protein [Bacillota bacterium]
MVFVIVLAAGLSVFEIFNFIKQKRQKEIALFLVLVGIAVFVAYLLETPGGISISGFLTRALDLHR